VSIYKRGRIYWSRIVRHGETFVRSTKCKNRADAIRIEAQWLVLAEDDNVMLRRSHIILAQFEERFFAYVDQNVASPKTRAYYKTHWKPLRDTFLGGLEISRINPQHIHNWATVRADEVGPASINGSLRTLRRALRLAHEWRIIKNMPKIRLVKGERSLKFVIDEELLAKMLGHAKCAPTLRTLLPFLIDTGLRLTEAMSLCWGNVDLKDDSLFVTHGKSVNARRTVPLTRRAKSIISALRPEKPKPEERVFNQVGSTCEHQFKALRDALSLDKDCVLHSCRHTFCTRLGAAGVSAFQIMRLAGHSSVSISQRYVQEDKKALRDAIALL
jgi:integrase